MRQHQTRSELRILAPIEPPPRQLGHRGDGGAPGLEEVPGAHHHQRAVERGRVARPGQRVEREHEQEEPREQPPRPQPAAFIRVEHPEPV